MTHTELVSSSLLCTCSHSVTIQHESNFLRIHIHTHTKLLTHIHVDDFGRKNTKMFTVAQWMVGMKAFLIFTFTYFTIVYKKRCYFYNQQKHCLKYYIPMSQQTRSQKSSAYVPTSIPTSSESWSKPFNSQRCKFVNCKTEVLILKQPLKNY